DPERVERAVVLDQPVVDVHRFGGHIAVARVPVERGDLRAARDGIPGHGRLPQLQPDGCRARPGDEPGGDRVGLRQVDEVLLRPRVEPPGSELPQHVVLRGRRRGGSGCVVGGASAWPARARAGSAARPGGAGGVGGGGGGGGGGGNDVLDRQRAVQAAAGEALRDTVLWLALGALCAPLVIYL